MQLLNLRFLIVYLSFTLIHFSLSEFKAVSAAPTKQSVRIEAFEKNLPLATKETLWLNHNLQKSIKRILDHPYPKLRLRYWLLKSEQSNQQKFQTLWYLNEIGKDKPISFAVSVIDNKVQFVEVLKFRESRGSEIKMSNFRKQFVDISLTPYQELDLQIDGISGATMSVTAIKKITRLALFLHSQVVGNL